MNLGFLRADSQIRLLFLPPTVLFHKKCSAVLLTTRSDLHEFNFDTSEWTAVQALGRRPRARYRATTVVHKDTMILFGGHDGTRHLNDTYLFDLHTKTWSALQCDGLVPTPRDSHVAVMHGNSMYIFGGSSGNAMNDLHELQLPTQESSSVARW